MKEFFEDHEALECINMLQKEDLDDPGLIMKIDSETLEKILDIKPVGKKNVIMRELKKLREEFEKEGKIHFMSKRSLRDPGTSLKVAKSHTFVPMKG